MFITILGKFYYLQVQINAATTTQSQMNGGGK